MKTILVPTDFSSSAEHATLYAAELAKQINATVSLLHVYQMPVTMSDFPVLIVSVEELRNNADRGLKRALEAAQEAVPGVQFESESIMGTIVEAINESCSNKDVVVLVAGTKDLSSFERFLLGNTAFSIVKNCSFPVITVPEGAAIKAPKKMAMAIDNAEGLPVKKIMDFVGLFSADLHIVHVDVEENAAPIQLPQTLKNAGYHSLKEDDVTKGLHQLAEQNNIDLLLVLPHKHSLFERLFFKGHTKDLINSMPIPVLSIQGDL